MKHGRASSRTFWPSLERNNGDIDQNLQKTDLSSRRGGCTSGLDLTSAATMQHPWLISRPDMPGYVHASGFVEASWPQRLDGDGPARSHRRAATECYGRGGKVHDDGSAVDGGWVCKTKSVPAVHSGDGWRGEVAIGALDYCTARVPRPRRRSQCLSSRPATGPLAHVTSNQ